MASRKRGISNDADVSAVCKEWDEALCPICMDHPHNAVLLICSAHGKGCRSYICDTSYRHSNCLDRYKKLKEENTDTLPAPHLIPGSYDGFIETSTNLDMATSVDINGDHTDHAPSQGTRGVNANHVEQEGNIWEALNLDEANIEKTEEGLDLRCPLCRGSVLGWKVVEDARKYLNLKARSCSHEACSFSGNYRELRGHARRVHPSVRPADVDPNRQRAWRRLEDQREYNDIVSAIRSAMPGAVILGDYVMENGDRDRLSAETGRGGGAGENGRLLNALLFFQMFDSMDRRAGQRGGGRPRVLPRHRRATRTFPRHRYLWGENLLGLQDDEEEERNEAGGNVRGDAGDDVEPNARRRRRLTRDLSGDNRQ